MNTVMLWFTRLFDPLWKIMGVDLDQFYAILRAKLKVDSRRKSGLFTGANMKEISGVQVIVFVLYFSIGALFLFFFVTFEHTPTALTIYFSVWMVFLIMSIVTDMSDVLVDTKDNYIILPTPVNGATLSTSRMVRITIFLFKQAFAFVLPALIYWAINNPIALPLFIFQSFLVIIMSLCLVTIAYQIAMKYSSPQKFKNIINYIQIGFTIVVFSAYQLLPKLIDMSDMGSANVFLAAYSYLMPSAWVAAIWEMFINGDFSSKTIIHVLLSLVGTLGAFVYISKYLSLDYSQQLLSIGQAHSDSPVSVKTEKSRQWLDRLANILTANKIEKTVFKFCFRYTGRNRTFKLKTYPIFGYVPIMFSGMFLKGEGSFAERLIEIQSGNHFIFLVYGTIFMVLVPLLNSKYSEYPNQSWIFKGPPIEQPKSIFIGVYKAIFVKYLIPTWLIFLALSIAVWGVRIIDDFMFGLIVLIFITLLVYRFMADTLPFSKDWSEMQDGTQTTVFIGFSLFLAIVGGIHYWFMDCPLNLLAFAVAGIIGVVIVWYSYNQVTWEKMDKAEMLL